MASGNSSSRYALDKGGLESLRQAARDEPANIFGKGDALSTVFVLLLVFGAIACLFLLGRF